LSYRGKLFVFSNLGDIPFSRCVGQKYSALSLLRIKLCDEHKCRRKFGSTRRQRCQPVAGWQVEILPKGAEPPAVRSDRTYHGRTNGNGNVNHKSKESAR